MRRSSRARRSALKNRPEGPRSGSHPYVWKKECGNSERMPKDCLPVHPRVVERSSDPTSDITVITVPYTSDKRPHKPAHMPLKPTLVEGVDVDVVNGIATDARTVTAGRCLCHKHNDSASCLGVTMHATDCMQAWATRSDRCSTQARGSSSCAHARATYGEQHATRHASQGDTSPILCWPTCPRYVYLVSEPGSERPFGRSAQANGNSRVTNA